MSSLLDDPDSPDNYLAGSGTDCTVRCLYRNTLYLFFCWDAMWAFGVSPNDERCRKTCPVHNDKIKKLLP